jgi:pimeloyl-ACP methyl ester carboxylesterase
MQINTLRHQYLFPLVLLLLTNSKLTLAASMPIKVYLIHGQGSDTRLFSKLSLHNNFDTVCLALPMPKKHQNMHEYAQLLLPKIDTNEAFILIGVSLGGMVAVELAEMIHPIATIIISSAKGRAELPKRYRFMRALPIYKIIPAGFIKFSSFIAQPLVEPDRNKEKALFKSMLKNKDKRFYKRSIPLIVNWDKQVVEKTGLFHVHGTRDKTIPIKNVKANYVLKNGSHMMVLTSSDHISFIVNLIIEDYTE